MIFREEATSALPDFHAGDLYLGQIGILSVGFVEEGKPENTEKNPRENHKRKRNPRTALESNPGHIGGRQALSALRWLSLPKLYNACLSSTCLKESTLIF